MPTLTRLLAGTVLAAGLVLIATPAAADCVRSENDLTCDTTTTSDLINDGSSPASERAYNIDLSSGNATVTILSGRKIDGAGLAVATWPAGPNTLSVMNNGMITTDPFSNGAFMGGTATLSIVGYGGANLAYSGAGTVQTGGRPAEDAIVMITEGTGNITASVDGTVVASGVDAFGVHGIHLGSSGNVALTLGQAGVIRAGNVGLNAFLGGPDSTGTINVANNGAILSPLATPGLLDRGIYAFSIGLGSVSVTNAGTIGAASDRARSGIEATIDSSRSQAAVTITSTGSIFADENGILADQYGSGAVAVSTGAGILSVMGQPELGTGIQTSAEGGSTSITVGSGGIQAGRYGIRAVSMAGAQNIQVGGQINVEASGRHGIEAVSTGGGAITVAVGASGGIQAPGDAIAVRSDNLKSISIASGRSVVGAIGIVSNGGGATNIENRGTLTGSNGAIFVATSGEGASIINAAGATLNGRLSLTDAADTFVNAGSWTMAGISQFGGGQDVLTNQAGGSMTIGAGGSIAGLNQFTNNGTLTVLSGLALTNGATAFTNAGTLNLDGSLGFLAGGSFVSTGTINAVSGATTISGVNVANSGTINLRDNGANDTLTITGNYTASTGAALVVDFSQSASDRLVIVGNVSGVTQVVISPIAGTARIDGDGLLLVDVGGTSTAAAFTTNASFNPLINLAIQQRGSDFYLVALPTVAGFRPLAVSNLATDLWYEGADTVGALAAADRPEKPTRLWVQGSVSRDRYGRRNEQLTAFGSPFTFSARQQSDRLALQAGGDLSLGLATLGLTAGYQRGDSKFGGAEVVKARGWNLGGYAAAGASTGLYGTLLAKLDRNQVALERTLFTGLAGEPDSRSIGLDGTVGYRLDLGGGSLDLSGGIALVRTRLDDFSAGGIAYSFKDQTSLRGDIGARFRQTTGLGLHAEGRLFREFDGDTELKLSSGASDTVRGGYRGTWARIGVGVGGTARLPVRVSAHADLGDVRGAGLTAGLAF